MSRAPFIHPNKIVTVEDWIKGTAKRYANLRLRESDGAMLVLDPSNPDPSAPVKEFSRTKAIDAVAYLQTGQDPKLREQAATRMATLASQRSVSAATLEEEFRVKEKDLLQTHQLWRQATNSADRILHATRVGVLQSELRELDTKRRQTMFPHRYILEKDMKRVVLDDETGQKRIAQRHVFAVNHTTTDAKDREILLGQN